MINLRDHLFPTTPEEAVRMLNALEGRGRILAGGTDLVEMLRDENPGIDVLVDIRRIESIKSITLRKDRIVIGGGVTHAQIATSDVIRDHATVLAEACLSIGGPQIRNLGTLAGNIVSAQPAADGSLALMGLGAILTVAGPGYKREVDIADAFTGVGVSTVDATKEVITEITLSADVREKARGSNYQRLAIRGALALPMVAAAAVVSLRDGHFKSVRLAIGPMAPIPLLVDPVNDVLRGKPPSRENILKAAETVGHVANPRSSLLRGSREYRLSMGQLLGFRAIMTAATRAQANEKRNEWDTESNSI
jgi:carbon-monoxide dehydrogenase medium subunit